MALCYFIKETDDRRWRCSVVLWIWRINSTFPKLHCYALASWLAQKIVMLLFDFLERKKYYVQIKCNEFLEFLDTKSKFWLCQKKKTHCQCCTNYHSTWATLATAAQKTSPYLGPEMEVVQWHYGCLHCSRFFHPTLEVSKLRNLKFFYKSVYETHDINKCFSFTYFIRLWLVATDIISTQMPPVIP